MQVCIDVQSLSFRGLVAIFDRVSVGFNVCWNSVLLVLVTDAKMVLKRRLMAMSLVSVVMFVRNIVLVKGLFVEREVSPGVGKNMRSDQSTF